MSDFSHLDDQGRASMVDISSKPMSLRTASAEGRVRMQRDTIDLINQFGLPKGDPFEVARLAGIQAAKQTAQLIPLCHSLNLDHVDVRLEIQTDGIRIESTVACRWATGVEMEALTAVSVAALSLYDMCKAVDKSMEIGEIRVTSKTKAPLSSGPADSQ